MITAEHASRKSTGSLKMLHILIQLQYYRKKGKETKAVRKKGKLLYVISFNDFIQNIHACRYKGLIVKMNHHTREI